MFCNRIYEQTLCCMFLKFWFTLCRSMIAFFHESTNALRAMQYQPMNQDSDVQNLGIIVKRNPIFIYNVHRLWLCLNIREYSYL